MDQQQEGDNGSLIELTAPEPEAQDVLLPLVSMESWSATSTMASNLVLARAASSSTQTASSSGSTCAADNNTPICAKPADAQPLTLPIALGVS